MELGLAIKEASPFEHTIIAELANGSIGYVPTRRAYGEGNYTVIVTADHGGHGRNHGEDVPTDMFIPWIVWGEGASRGMNVADGVRTMDTAATVLWLLGVLAVIKLAMGLNSIFNGSDVLISADGVPLATYPAPAAQTIVAIFALWALGQLLLALLAVLTALRAADQITYLDQAAASDPGRRYKQRLLTALDLRCCEAVTDIGMLAVTRACVLLQSLNVLVSLCLSGGLFAMIYKLMPRTPIAWPNWSPTSPTASLKGPATSW